MYYFAKMLSLMYSYIRKAWTLSFADKGTLTHEHIHVHANSCMGAEKSPLNLKAYKRKIMCFQTKEMRVKRMCMCGIEFGVQLYGQLDGLNLML